MSPDDRILEKLQTASVTVGYQVKLSNCKLIDGHYVMSVASLDRRKGPRWSMPVHENSNRGRVIERVGPMVGPAFSYVVDKMPRTAQDAT